jgi:NAD(P)-dependent dehydrogenase (short-subunit alcohol dehydrogenase family)
MSENNGSGASTPDGIEAEQEAAQEPPEPRSLEWALVLGSSSGFGAAAAAALAERAGLNVCGVHLRRPANRESYEQTRLRIEAAGRKYLPFQINAANADRRKEALDGMAEAMDGSGFRVIMHSLAFGTLKPYIAARPDDAISQANMEMTLDVMAHSLVYWVQDCVSRGLLGRGSRIFAMSSSGAHSVVPNYGAVSAAKAALEAHIRQLAYELAPRGITATAINAGVTHTPALHRIPGNDRMVDVATERNPSGRLTTPDDVANFIALFALPGPGADWVTGNVINVDGGEDIAG